MTPGDAISVRGLGATSVLATLWVCVWGALAVEVSAHVIMGSPSLHLRIASADLVVRGRVVDPRARFVSADGGTRRSLVEIRVLEILKGDWQGEAGADRIRFAQNGHEVARYEAGEEALFFLDPIEKSRELAVLGTAGRVTHVSGQEHDERFPVTGPFGEGLLAATRTLIASEKASAPEERVALIRRATFGLLTSGDDELGSMGLAALVLSPNAALVTPSELPRLEKLLGDSSRPIGFRAGLLAELDRRGMVSAAPHWLALLEGARPKERSTAIRAAAANPSPAVVDFLIARLADSADSVEVAAEAAVALGNARELRSVRALEGALEHESARVRNAAIRGLGRIGSVEALAVLERAAHMHGDQQTRRRAEAAVRTGRNRRDTVGAADRRGS